VVDPEAFGYEALDRLAEELVAGPPEQPLDLVVHEDDVPAGVHDQERIGRRREQPPQQVL
jgi:hypothetical protein